MNVSPRASIDASASRGAGTATARPTAAGGDAGFVFEQALQARAAREPGACGPAMRERPSERPSQAQAAREQPLCELVGAGADTEAADAADALCSDARRRREAGSEREGQEPADVEPPPRQDISTMPAAPAAAAAGPGAASGNGTSSAQPQDAGPTRTALAMALGMPAFPADAATAGRWEVSIPQAGGAPLELLAGRAPMVDGSAGWTLDIRSRARDIHGAMARSASRLSDRLEARAISARVRIEDDEDEAP